MNQDKAPIEIRTKDGKVAEAFLNLPSLPNDIEWRGVACMGAKRNHNRSRLGFGKLEVLLVMAFLALLFQVFPSLWFGMLWAINPANWSRWVWLLLNVAVVLVLFSIRFAPELLAAWQQKRRKHRSNPVSEMSAKEKGDWHNLSAKEQRELFERMKEARKKQAY